MAQNKIFLTNQPYQDDTKKTIKITVAKKSYLAIHIFLDHQPQELHHPHYYQIKKGLNNMFNTYSPKSSMYSTTMKLKNHTLHAGSLHSCVHEEIFTKIYRHLGVMSHTWYWS